MKPIRKKRLQIIIFMVLALMVASALILYALRQNINLYYTPAQLFDSQVQVEQTIRLGGVVEQGSIKRGENLAMDFTITDMAKQVQVHYEGVLPDLFREGQGVVVQGQLQQDNTFKADTVLAKHDENYMPPDVLANKSPMDSSEEQS